MNFELTEERRMLQDTLRRYLRAEYSTERRNAILDSAAGYAPEIWSGLADLGVIGALFDEAQGGFGGAGFDIAVVFEELGRAGVVEPLLDGALLAGRALALAGRQDIVDGLIAGDVQLAFAHYEPGGRYDLDYVQTEASGGGLTGRKAVVMHGGAAEHIVVSARDGDQIGLYLVNAGAPGLDARDYPLLAGGRAAEVMLDNTPAEPLGLGLAEIESLVALAMVAQCAEALGAMETAVALTQDYLMTRKQFGRPIGTFQALAHRMADLLIELEQARSAVINAAGMLGTRDEATTLAASKNLIGRVGRQVAEEAIQMHGGIAMTQEYELAHIAKRIIMADHRFGDTDYHLERFIALSAA
ncbi:acyl-CoA dehydrogenase [uncultured Tateyamaria sp.]|uniref:acyl-CoA dehydrogenase family protein n=1 Tax=Tateyamaria sp. 1078 TaxID=3417464 RepID=UPI00263114A6|nr:acyl-CoA dehydrogenase [uncultured Tateyamaria sp.]